MQNPVTAAPVSTSNFAELAATPSHGPLRIEYRWLNQAAAHAPIAVFLHEGLGSIAMWRDWPQALCERLGMRGLVYSRPGYGLSTPRAHEVKWPVDFMTAQARDILPALFDALDIGAQDIARLCGSAEPDRPRQRDADVAAWWTGPRGWRRRTRRHSCPGFLPQALSRSGSGRRTRRIDASHAFARGIARTRQARSEEGSNQAVSIARIMST